MAVTREMIAHLRAENLRLRTLLREYQQEEDEPAYGLFRMMVDHPPSVDWTGVVLRVARRVLGSRPPDYDRHRRRAPPANKRS